MKLLDFSLLRGVIWGVILLLYEVKAYCWYDLRARSLGSEALAVSAKLCLEDLIEEMLVLCVRGPVEFFFGMSWMLVGDLD